MGVNLEIGGFAGQPCLAAGSQRKIRHHRRRTTGAVSAEVAGEEPQRAVQFEGREVPVLAGMGVQRLLG